MIRRRGGSWVVTIYNPLTKGKSWVGTFRTEDEALTAEMVAKVPRPLSRAWGLASKGEDECRNCGQPAEHLHHIVPRKLLPTHVPVDDPLLNGLPLCTPCHIGWHHRSVLLASDLLKIEEMAFALGAVGHAWVSANYPGDRPVDVDQGLMEEVSILRAELRRLCEGDAVGGRRPS